MLALLPIALAAPITDGERLEWAVSWMGIPAGTAWAVLEDAGDGWTVEAGGKSAGWLAELYPVDDWIHSDWATGGSRRYRTRFREGRFQQDQDMLFAGGAVTVSRSQRFDEGWRSWEQSYSPGEGLEDPVSAFYRLRVEAPSPGGELRFRVWSGRKAGTVVARTVGREGLDSGPALRVEVATGYHSEDVKSTLTLYVSDDADRVPVACVLHTRAGPVRMDLTTRTVD